MPFLLLFQFTYKLQCVTLKCHYVTKLLICEQLVQLYKTSGFKVLFDCLFGQIFHLVIALIYWSMYYFRVYIIVWSTT